MKRVFILTLLLVTAMLAAESWEELLARGRELCESEKYEEAIEVYNRAIELLPEGEGEMLYYERGRAYEGENDRDGALADYSKALEIEPNYDMALSGRADIYRRLGYRRAALNDYLALHNLYPTKKSYILYIAALKSSLYDFTGALKELEKIEEGGWDRSLADSLRQNIYMKMGEEERVLEEINRLFESHSRKSFAYYNRALYYTHLGDYESAFSDLQKGNSSNPGTFSILKELLNTSLALGEIESARYCLQQIKELKYGAPKDYYSSLAYPLMQLGELEEALSYVEKELELDENSVWAPLVKAFILLKRKKRDNEEVARLAKRSIEVKPGSANQLYSSAHILTFLERYEEAIEVSKRGIELDNRFPYIYFAYYTAAKLSGSKVELENSLNSLQELDESYLKDGWTDRIRAYLLGELDIEGFLKEAGSSNPRICDANFYIAMSLVGEAKPYIAKGYLKRALKTNCLHSYEYYAAEYLLNNFRLISRRG